MSKELKAVLASGAVVFLAMASLVRASAIDQVVGAVAPNGGAQLVKRFNPPVGSVVLGVELVSNDLRTVFPKVALLQGPAEKISEAVILREQENVRAVLQHRIHVGFPPIAVTGAEELYIAVSLPASNGVRAVKDGPGLGATRLGEPNGSFLASPPDGTLYPVDVDLAIELVLQSPGKPTPKAYNEDKSAVTSLRTLNPVSASAGGRIEFTVTGETWATLVVYDVAGRLVRELARGSFPRGKHYRIWDGLDKTGDGVGAGVYFVQLQAGRTVLSDKLVVLR
jgi:flagellar hook capping protein FlgD